MYNTIVKTRKALTLTIFKKFLDLANQKTDEISWTTLFNRKVCVTSKNSFYFKDTTRNYEFNILSVNPPMVKLHYEIHDLSELLTIQEDYSKVVFLLLLLYCYTMFHIPLLTVWRT